ncbi:MAG: P-II family nitrogen regulator [Streptosporangiaceae bacterium]
MKLITAVVRPDKLDDVVQTVAENGAHGLTATEAMGFGQQFGRHGAAARSDQSALVLPKVRVDMVVPDELAGPLTDAIAKAVNTGSIGDGKIWISPVDSVLRVRTGERDDAAV